MRSVARSSPVSADLYPASALHTDQSAEPTRQSVRLRDFSPFISPQDQQKWGMAWPEPGSLVQDAAHTYPSATFELERPLDTFFQAANSTFPEDDAAIWDQSGPSLDSGCTSWLLSDAAAPLSALEPLQGAAPRGAPHPCSDTIDDQPIKAVTHHRKSSSSALGTHPPCELQAALTAPASLLQQCPAGNFPMRSPHSWPIGASSAAAGSSSWMPLQQPGRLAPLGLVGVDDANDPDEPCGPPCKRANSASSTPTFAPDFFGPSRLANAMLANRTVSDPVLPRDFLAAELVAEGLRHSAHSVKDSPRRLTNIKETCGPDQEGLPKILGTSSFRLSSNRNVGVQTPPPSQIIQPVQYEELTFQRNSAYQQQTAPLSRAPGRPPAWQPGAGGQAEHHGRTAECLFPDNPTFYSGGARPTPVFPSYAPPQCQKTSTWPNAGWNPGKPQGIKADHPPSIIPHMSFSAEPLPTSAQVNQQALPEVPFTVDELLAFREFAAQQLPQARIQLPQNSSIDSFTAFSTRDLASGAQGSSNRQMGYSPSAPQVGS